MKGASEYILADCSSYSDAEGNAQSLTPTKKQELDTVINDMAREALRTLCLAHKVYKSETDMPENWREHPPGMSV